MKKFFNYFSYGLFRYVVPVLKLLTMIVFLPAFLFMMLIPAINLLILQDFAPFLAKGVSELGVSNELFATAIYTLPVASIDLAIVLIYVSFLFWYLRSTKNYLVDMSVELKETE